MALVKCHECGTQVSTEAATCPNCGAPSKRNSASSAVAKTASGIWTLIKLFIGFIVLLFVYECSQIMVGHEQPSSTATSGAARQSTTTAPATQAATPVSAPGWEYSSEPDPMTSKPIATAFIQSTNSLNLQFPYAGSNYGHLVVRTSKKGGQPDVMFQIDKGQTMCRSYEYDCVVNVRFDDGAPIRFLGIGPSDNSTEIAFLNQPARFVAGAAKAKKIRVSMDIYQAGTQVLDFEPSEGLRWPPK